MRKKKGSNLSKEFRKVTEYVISYKNSTKKFELFGIPAYTEKQVPLLNRSNNISNLKFEGGIIQVGNKFPEGITQAKYFGSGELVVKLLNDINVKDRIIQNPFSIEGRFRWAQDTVNDELNNGSIFTVSKDFRINISRYNQSEKFKSPSSLLSPNDGIGTNEDATEELRYIFNELDKIPFDFPKPSSLIKQLILSVSKNDKEAIILDSFSGTGTTGHAVLKLNKEDGGNRKFILVELEEKIAQEITAERISRVINGYTIEKPNGKKEEVEGLGGGFRFCKLGEPLFDQNGNIREDVKFEELARHIYFSETGLPLPEDKIKKSPFIGTHNGTAYYLLFNGVLGDKSIHGGNILTSKILSELPKYEGPKVIFGEGTRLSSARLKKKEIEFKQLPYEIKAF